SLPVQRRSKASAGTLERLQELLADAVARGVDYRRVLEKTDKNHSGVISAGGLKAALHELDGDLRRAELEELADVFWADETSEGTHYDERGHPRDDGGVNYVEMLLWAQGHGGDNMWRLSERLRQMIRRRFDWQEPGALRKGFKHFDQRGHGRLSETDLGVGLRKLGFRLKAEEERELMLLMDLDRDGRVQYTEFVVFVRDPNHRDIAKKVIKKLKHAGIGCEELLDELDPYGDEESAGVTIKQAGKALERLGVTLTKGELERFSLRFDEHENGLVDPQRVAAFASGMGENDLPIRRGSSPRLSPDRQRQRARPSPTTRVGADEEEALKRKLKLRTSPRDVMDVMGRYDVTGREVIDEEDALAGMESLGLVLSRSEKSALLAICRPAGGGFKYETLAALVGGRNGKGNSRSSLEEALSREMARLRLDERSLLRPFTAMDDCNDGTIGFR
ncbi:unnamed protein product, partial [Chrysoparadoxa australica]